MQQLAQISEAIYLALIPIVYAIVRGLAAWWNRQLQKEGKSDASLEARFAEYLDKALEKEAKQTELWRQEASVWRKAAEDRAVDNAKIITELDSLRRAYAQLESEIAALRARIAELEKTVDVED